ncbi:hypothetical protein ACP275_10G155500 [Erythranthe tilingii]
MKPPLLSCVLGIAVSSWICFKLFHESKPKKIVRGSVPAAERTMRLPIYDDDNDEELIVETRDASPAHFLTKIESFSLFPKHWIVKYETCEFEAGGYKWRLIIYPSGRPYSPSGYISVYLSLAETSSLPVDWEFNAIFTIFLYNQISDNYLCFRGNERRFNKIKFEWGFPKFINKKSLKDELSGYLVDDNFVLGAEVFVLKTQRVIECVTLLKPPSIDLRTRDWKISEFSKLENAWISDEFTMSGFNWKMELYPKGDFSSKDRAVTIYLVCVSAGNFDARQKVKTEFYTRLKGKSVATTIYDVGKLSHWFTSSNATCWTSFISLSELHNPKNGFLVDDCFNLQVEICVQVLSRP